MRTSLLIAVLLLLSFQVRAACEVGQMTELTKSVSIIPCGKFDVDAKVCTDTEKTELPAGTMVHVTEKNDARIEVYVGMVPEGRSDRYINKFLTFNASSDAKNLQCQ